MVCKRAALFRGRHFTDEIIVLCVRWYLRYSLSYRDLTEIMWERNLSIDPSTLFAYYESIGRATELPLIIYTRDWAVFTPEMVARLADRVPTLAAWKDGQGDIRRYQRIMEYNGDRLAWFGGSGDDCVSGYFAIGVQAYTSSISNISPRLSLALTEAGMS